MILKVAHNTASGKLFPQNEIRSLRWVKGRNRKKKQNCIVVGRVPALKSQFISNGAEDRTPGHSASLRDWWMTSTLAYNDVTLLNGEHAALNISNIGNNVN